MLLASIQMAHFSGRRIEPAYIGVDFERDFFKQVAKNCPDAELLVVFFHVKQAIRKKMIKLGMSDKEVTFAMKKGVVYLKIVISKE